MDRHKIISDQLQGIIEILGNQPIEKGWKSILKEAIILIGENKGVFGMTKKVNDLADQHWEYINKVLENANIKKDLRKVIGFHCRTAFIHGYKHCLEGFTNTMLKRQDNLDNNLKTLKERLYRLEVELLEKNVIRVK